METDVAASDCGDNFENETADAKQQILAAFLREKEMKINASVLDEWAVEFMSSTGISNEFTGFWKQERSTIQLDKKFYQISKSLKDDSIEQFCDMVMTLLPDASDAITLEIKLQIKMKQV